MRVPMKMPKTARAEPMERRLPGPVRPLAVVVAVMLAASSPSASTAFDNQRSPFDKGSGAQPGIRRPPPHDLEHPTQREMSDPSWRPWLKWEWCTDARGVRFRCQR
jgi:hypothetical protein